MRLDVVTANLKVTSSLQSHAAGDAIPAYVARTFGRFPDVLGLQEAKQLQQVPADHNGDRLLGRYRLLLTDHRGPDGWHANTDAILLKQHFEDPAIVWHHGAPGFGNRENRYGRTWAEATYVKRGRPCAHVTGHLSLIHEPPRGHADLARETPLIQSHAEHALAMVDAADRLRAEGRLVTLTADSNDSHPWHYSLAVILERRGYIVEANGIDLVAGHSSQLEAPAPPAVSRVVVPRSVTESDHEALGKAFATL